MKILHICLNGPYVEGWGYQENLLPKYHKKLGHEVWVLANNKKHIDTGEIIDGEEEKYISENGINVHRIKPCNTRCRRYNHIFRPYNIYDILKRIRPDFIMLHGFIGTIAALQVRKFKRKINKECRIVMDVHQDEHNSKIKHNIKGHTLRYIHRFLNGLLYPMCEHIFFVAPSSLKMAIKYYNAPVGRMRLLPLSADTDLFESNRLEARRKIESRYNLLRDNILITHGGKLNDEKKTVELIRAIKRIYEENSRIRLLIFGSIQKNYYENLSREIEKNQGFVVYMGMLRQEEYYSVFRGSDIAVFPGSQSVIWQQAIAAGLAVAVKRFEAIEYLDVGGNLSIIEQSLEDNIYDVVQEMLKENKFQHMKKVAENEGYQFFSYEQVAKEVIGNFDEKDSAYAEATEMIKRKLLSGDEDTHVQYNR